MSSQVYVNGLQCCLFKHRVPLEKVSTISIYGDVTIPIYGFIDVSNTYHTFNATIFSAKLLVKDHFWYFPFSHQNWRKPFTFMDLLKMTDMGGSFSSLLPILSEVSHPVIFPVRLKAHTSLHLYSL